MRITFRPRVVGFLALATLALGACMSPAEKQKQQQELQSQLDQITALSAEKDTMLQAVAENARLMNEINTEMAKVKDLKAGVAPVVGSEGGQQPVADQRAIILARVKEMTERLNDAEKRLGASQARIRRLSKQSDSMKTNLASLETAVAEYQQMIATQRVEIATMSEQLATTQEEVTQLSVEKAALIDTVTAITDRGNMVYYVIGTKDSLKAKGIIVEEGGTKFLFFGSHALQPARVLNEADFTAVDRRVVMEIPSPMTTQRYRIVSRQNTDYSENKPDSKGRVTGGVKIASPEGFWAPSKFLILVLD
jgi:predicted  nucleic acid-binding Zn-ribbon protein